MTWVREDLAHARVMLGLKRYDEAASLLALVVAVEPDYSRVWCLLAQAYLGNAQYQEAADAASRAIALAPADDWPYRLASIAHRHRGHSTSAWRAATEACKLAPNQWQSYVCLAQAEMARQVDSEAPERAAAKARELAPDEPEVHYVSGLVSFAGRRWKAARAHQERALALDAAHSGALNELGRIKLRRGNHAGAVQHFLQAAQSAPGQSIYGRNVDVAVRKAVAQPICIAVWANFMLLYATLPEKAPRVTLMVGYAAIAVLSAGFAAVYLWRMPPETHPLFRTRRVALPLAAVYGSILIAVIVAALTPVGALPGVLPGALLAVTALIAAYTILQNKKQNRRPDMRITGPVP
jgi:tetratricopeptide (TPR) repeat protein